MTPPHRLVVVAPNWLGDAVMALPLLADIARAWPATDITVAGRPSVAALFRMSDTADDVVTLDGGGGWRALGAVSANVERLSAGDYDAALLLPNSFIAAWTVRRARVPERWGYRSDARGPLLTRAVQRPRRPLHQAEYYQNLGATLGIDPGPRHARLTVPAPAQTTAASRLEMQGLAPGTRYVAMAPGAAYGRAKQWLPARFAELAVMVAREHGVRTVLVGTRADVPVCAEIVRLARENLGTLEPWNPGTLNLAGHTDLETLAAVLQRAAAVVANDSGAMHLAAAVGARLVAVFGATDERRTAPLASGSPGQAAPAVIASHVWCRPCLLRECPIDHRCMRAIGARHVFDALALT